MEFSEFRTGEMDWRFQSPELFLESRTGPSIWARDESIGA